VIPMTCEYHCETCGFTTELRLYEQAGGLWEPASGNDECPECGEPWGSEFQPWNKDADPVVLAAWISDNMGQCPLCDKDPVTQAMHDEGVPYAHTVVTFTGCYPGAWRCECGCVFDTE